MRNTFPKVSNGQAEMAAFGDPHHPTTKSRVGTVRPPRSGK
jgi:hypothetical protein